MHTIKLTGKPVSKLRDIKGGIYAFDMEEAGSAAAPKGLYTSSKILYTVFINKKQLQKLGLAREQFFKTKFLIQGEPVLDVPLNLCPGEIGVTTFQISPIQQPTAPKENAETKAAVSNDTKNQEPVLEEHIHIDRVIILEKAKEQVPNPKKQKTLETYIEEHGKMKQPLIITVKNGRAVLTSRYGDYLAAQKLGLDKVLVKYQPFSVKDYPDKTDDVILLSKINIPEHLTPSNPLKIKQKVDYYKENNKFIKPIEVDKETLTLKDGYTTYTASKELNLDYIPVTYI
ncbi:MAG: hypothetical protein N4A54_04155 [Peptostreptococcaceae bacterium]|jgi:hypothetical protein|nr:hypothetical protein [Peptostreptococcaceae bacterium]